MIRRVAGIATLILVLFPFAALVVLEAIYCAWHWLRTGESGDEIVLNNKPLNWLEALPSRVGGWS